jgi:hypothetical protein
MGRMTSHILWRIKNVPNHQPDWDAIWEFVFSGWDEPSFVPKKTHGVRIQAACAHGIASSSVTWSSQALGDGNMSKDV